MGLLSGIVTALFASSVIAAKGVSADDFDVLDYVDPLIGTANGGLSWNSLALLQENEG
jgi:hypothetical protein